MRILIVILLCFAFHADAQRYRERIDSLCSPEFFGRGYYRKGDSLASSYLQREFKKIGLLPFTENYLQPFTFAVNTFPGKASVTLGNKNLSLGIDFIPAPSCKSIQGTYDLFVFNKNVLHSKKQLKRLNKKDFSKTVILVDKTGFDEKKNKSSKTSAELLKMILSGVFNNPATLILEDKLTWGVSTFQSHPVFRLTKNAADLNSKSITIDLESKLIENHTAYNVAGYVKGTQHPDSFLFITAHFDHLGSIGGQAIFRGANDNASGVALLLELADKVQAKPLPCSVVFIAFAGEEAGLLGSDYYVEHPLVPLRKTGFVTNFDITGTGNEGIMIVNGTQLESTVNILKKVNDATVRIDPIKLRGQAPISDHYRFSEAGVKAMYIYTLGGNKAYHDIQDIPSNLTFDVFEKLAELMYQFYSGPVN